MLHCEQRTRQDISNFLLRAIRCERLKIINEGFTAAMARRPEKAPRDLLGLEKLSNKLSP